MILSVERIYNELSRQRLLSPQYIRDLCQEVKVLLDGSRIFLKGLPRLRTSCCKGSDKPRRE